MRQIKFRIWAKDAKRWLCEDSQYLVMDGSEVLAALWSTIKFKTNDENYVIQQFTGLLDSKGKEIYEGDILSCIQSECYPSMNLEVKFIEKDGRWAACNKKYDVAWNLGDGYSNKETKLIGNIFKTPELLNESNKT